MAEVVRYTRTSPTGRIDVWRKAGGSRIGSIGARSGVFLPVQRTGLTAPELRAIAAELERLEGTDG